MKDHYIIPIFIPEKACPFRCIYCNQYHIANQLQVPEREEVIAIIEQYLQTIPPLATKRVAFFGGSFTGMTLEEQRYYLEMVQPYIKRGEIDHLQLSTRPDYVNEEILLMLKNYGVEIIELGAQSLNEEVLAASGRGHTVEDVVNASKLIRKFGFQLGLQMMVGLPYDTCEKSVATAHKIVELGATYTRIYPTLVIKDTDLAEQYHAGEYTPLSLQTAVNWCVELLPIFEEGGVNVLRLGLHPSEGFTTGDTLLAGPFHVSFKELVITERWRRIWEKELANYQGNAITIWVAPIMMNTAIGYHATNKQMWQKHFKKVTFLPDITVQNYDYKIAVS